MLPLPEFVLQFLAKNNLSVSPEPNNRREVVQPSAVVFNSLDTLVRARTFDNIKSTYGEFLALTYDAPVTLQHEYQQFVFPFFIHLAVQLFTCREHYEAIEFVNLYREAQPHECQGVIDRLMEEKAAFSPPRFDVQITQFALDGLMRSIESKKQALMSVIMSTHINRQLAPIGHDLLFVGVGDATGTGPEQTILSPIEGAPKDLSVIFDPNHATRAPGIMQNDDGRLWLTQGLPDVAHLAIYNHSNKVVDMRISQCARLLAVAEDANVLVYRLDNGSGMTFTKGRKTATIASHHGTVLTTAFSHDSRFVVSGGMDCQIRVANTEVFSPIAHFKMHLKPVLSTSWDYRAEYIAAASHDRTATMWSLRTPTCLRCFVGHSLPASRVIFSHDNRSVVTCSSDLSIRVWDIGTGDQMAKFACGASVPRAVDISRDNRLLACGCDDGSVVLWDAVSGVHKWTSREIDSRLTDVKFTADGTLLMASSLDGRVCAWNLKAEGPVVAMKDAAVASTIDSMTVTDLNLVCTAGRSTLGDVAV